MAKAKAVEKFVLKVLLGQKEHLINILRPMPIWPHLNTAKILITQKNLKDKRKLTVVQFL